MIHLVHAFVLLCVSLHEESCVSINHWLTIIFALNTFARAVVSHAGTILELALAILCETFAFSIFTTTVISYAITGLASRAAICAGTNVWLVHTIVVIVVNGIIAINTWSARYYILITLTVNAWYTWYHVLIFLLLLAAFKPG